MEIELRIQANSLEEIAHIFAAKAAAYPVGYNAANQVSENVQEPGANEEVAREETAPKPRRGRKADKEPTAGGATEAGGSKDTPASAEPSTSDEKVTLDDLRAAAEPIMAAGKGREIQEMLLAKFNVRAFGPLPEESYPAALAELHDLAV